MDTQTWSAELEDIFVNQRHRLCCVAAIVLGSADQADDVVQDAYLKISETIRLFEVKLPISYVSRLEAAATVPQAKRALVYHCQRELAAHICFRGRGCHPR